jgi:protein NEDD1
MIVSVGLDKKLYIYDPGVKKPVYSVPYDAPFSSLAFRDDGNTLAVGTNSGCVVFFDMRGRPQPFTILRAYSSSEAVTSLSWQCSNPIAVTGSNCSLEVALLGTSSEDSVIMPDPLPASGLGTRGRIPAAVGSTKPSTWASSLPNNDNPTNRIGASGIGGSSVAGGITTRPKSAGGDITPFSSSRIWANGPISRLQTPRTTSFYNGIDDMEVFSPLVDVQPITPSISSFWDRETSGIESAGENTAVGGDSSSRRSTFGSPASAALRRFPSIEDMEKEQRRLSLGSSQDGTQKRTSFDSPATSTPVSGALSKMERSPSLTPPEAWGGEPLEKGSFRQQPPTMSRYTSLVIDLM